MNLTRALYAVILCVSCAAPVAGEDFAHQSSQEHQVTRPTESPDWATNVNFADGIDIGTPTKTAPSGGRLADGWRNGDEPPAQEENWWHNLIGRWIDWFDNGNVAYVDVAGYSRGQVDGTRIYVPEIGWYQFHTAPPFTADAFWAIDGVGGQWVHEHLAWVHLSKMAAVGPTPGDALSTLTPTGRINPNYIHYGHQFHVAGGPGTFSTSSITLTTITTIASLGMLKQHDLVVFTGSATAACTDGYQVAIYYSTDAGATWTSAFGGLPHYNASGAARNVTFPLAFAMELPGDTAGSFQIAVRGQVDSAVACSVTLSNWLAEVRRGPNN